jgi:hypothetical protein
MKNLTRLRKEISGNVFAMSLSLFENVLLLICFCTGYDVRTTG